MCKNEEMLILLNGRLDGFNSPEEDARLEAHLAECPDCRRTLEEYRKLDAGIAGLPGNVPDGFAENVMRAVNAEPRKVKKTRRSYFGFATAAAAVAAIFLLAVGSGKLPPLSNGSAKLFDTSKKAADVPAAQEEAIAAEEPMAEAEPAPQRSLMAEETESELTASTYFQAEVVEISNGTMLVKPLEGYAEASDAKNISVVIQTMPSSPEPRVGDVIEVTYNGTMTQEDPPSPEGVVSIKVISRQ